MTRAGGRPSSRAGTFRRKPGGFHAFHPAPYPPSDLQLNASLLQLLSQADRELGKLVGATEILPNPDLLVMMYVRREAVLSSQIEGTQASLMDLLEWEASRASADRRVDVAEVSNYLAALRFGLRRVQALPVSLRLIREIHARLMRGARGGDPTKTRGEFRRSQNWVGGPSPATARFVPPSVPAMHEALDRFERSLHAESPYPLLIRVGLGPAFAVKLLLGPTRRCSPAREADAASQGWVGDVSFASLELAQPQPPASIPGINSPSIR